MKAEELEKAVETLASLVHPLLSASAYFNNSFKVSSIINDVATSI